MAFWCVFWHDVWTCNKTLPPFEAAADLLDTSRPDSLAYRPIPQAELTKILEEKGLYEPPPSRAWLHSGVIQLLYDGVAAAAGSPRTDPGAVEARKPSQVAPIADV